MAEQKKNKGFFSKSSKDKQTCCGTKAPQKMIDNAALNRMISERAYHLWEAEGRPQGQDFNHWVKAEKDIYARIKR